MLIANEPLTMQGQIASPGRRAKAAQCLFACTLVLGLIGGAMGFSRALYPETPAIERVVGVASTTQQPPAYWPEDQALRSAQLPRRFCAVTNTACYDHYRIQLPAAKAPRALFLPGFSGSVAIAMDGVRKATYGTLNAPMERLIFRPGYVPIASQASSELVITIGADAQQFFRLEPFHIGDPAQLLTTWRFSHWLSYDLLATSIGIYAALGMLALMAFLLADRNPLFIWFVAIVVSASLRNTYFLWTEPGFALQREALYLTASLFLLASSAGFAGAMISDGRERRYRWVLVGSLVLAAVLTWRITAAPYEATHQANNIVRLLGVATGVWVMVLLWRYLNNEWHAAKPWVLALFVGAFALVLHDISPIWSNETILLQLSNLAPLLLVLAFCLILALQLGQALSRVNSHNLHLRQAIAQREQELEVAYGSARSAERAQAVASERERILRDVHDGVGGRLAGLILMARRAAVPEIADHLEISLVDLRLIIDSLDDTGPATVAQTLEQFKERITPWLHSHAVNLVFESSETPHPPLAAGRRLHLLRILQEATNNVIRHANASSITMELTQSSAMSVITLSDNGSGFAQNSASRGRGLTNMAHRSQLIGAEMELQAEPNRGTTLTLTLPALVPHEYGDDVKPGNR